MKLNSEKTYYTYGMIKPDGMGHIEEILKMILAVGLSIDYAECEKLTPELIDENYEHIKSIPIYREMKAHLLSEPVLKMLIYDKDGDAVLKYRKVLGVTKSWLADEGTIRACFGSKDENTTYKNTAHGSGNKEEANEEIIRFFGTNIIDILERVRNAGKINVLEDIIKENPSILGHYSDDQQDLIELENRVDFTKKKG